MQAPKIGQIVGYVLPYGRSAGQVRPAIVVHVWDDQFEPPEHRGTVQLQVFTDSDEHGQSNDALPCPFWATSVTGDLDKAPGTWHQLTD